MINIQFDQNYSIKMYTTLEKNLGENVSNYRATTPFIGFLEFPGNPTVSSIFKSIFIIFIGTCFTGDDKCEFPWRCL